MSVHITCGSGGAYSGSGICLPVERAALAWSETLSAPGTTAAAAAAITYSYASNIFTIVAIAIQAWIAIGAAPNAGANPRRYLLAGEKIQVEAQPGDRVAWAAVS